MNLPEPVVRARANERRVLFSTCLGHFLAHLYMLVFPALVTPLRHELGLDLAQALGLSFLGYLLFGLGALPAGIVTDRWSARWMLVICLGTSGAGAVLAGLSRTPGELMAALAVIGLGASIYHPTGMALISRAFAQRRGWALGINGAFGNVGLASAPFVAGLLAALFGWRWAYGLLAVPGLVGAVVVAALPMDERDVESHQSSGGGFGDGVPLERYFLVLCVAMTLGGLAYRGTSVVLPTYFEVKATFLEPVVAGALALLGGTGARTAAATSLTSLVYVMGIVGQIVGGRLADRYDLRSSYLLFHLATVPFLLAMVSLVEGPLLLAAMGYVLFGLGMQPIENSLVAKLTPPRWRSTAYGLKFILTFGIGAFAVGLVGQVERWAGLEAVFVCIAAIEATLVVTAALLYLMSRRTLVRVANAA